MVRISRLLKMKPSLIIKKLIGYDEVYSILYRKCQPNEKPIYNKMRYRFMRICDNSDYWYADPIVYAYNSKTYIFMEAFCYKKQKGCIAYSVLKSNGLFSSPQIVLEEDYHMSFPMIFEWNDYIYMIPETSANKSLNVYKSVKFPEKWEKVCELDACEGIVDAIVLEKNDNRVLLLASVPEVSNPLKTKYQIYSIENRNNVWSIIPQDSYNSKQSFRYDARNAGILFEVEEKKLHPVQVSTELDYGKSVKVFCYNQLLNDCIVENRIGSVSAANIIVDEISRKQMVGVHTYYKNADLEVMDLRYYKFRPLKWYYKFRARYIRHA